MTGWRVALRIGRRQVRRARTRAALVVAMIALPVAASAFAAVGYDTMRLAADERADRLMGSAQAVVIWPQGGPVHQQPTGLGFRAVGTPVPASEPSEDRLLALLPPGATATPARSGTLMVATSAGIAQIDARVLDYSDPPARGILRPLSGRAPATGDEVALTAAGARRIGTGLGGTVRLAGSGRAFRVVAIVEAPDDLAAATMVLRAGALSPAELPAGPRDHASWLVDTPGVLTWAQVKQLNTHGVVAVSRHVLAHPPGPAERYPVDLPDDGAELPLDAALLSGGLAMLELVLLTGPAFAIGARRRQRELALVAAAGATPAQVRRIVLADGVVLGGAAAVLGVGLGVVALAAGRPLLETQLFHARFGALRVFPAALATLAALAVLTGVSAALVPAWISARQDVVTALAGRRATTRSRRRWWAAAVLLGATGAAAAGVGARRTDSSLILAGLVVAELGLVLATPAVVGLVARLGRSMPPGPRIALRDVARHRTAAAPAVSAVMVAVAASLATGVVLAASNQRARDGYHPRGRTGDVLVYDAFDGRRTALGGRPPLASAAIGDALRATLPVEQVHEIAVPVCGSGDCLVEPRMPAARECPYSFDRLHRDATRAEQRAARRDPRCADATGDYTGLLAVVVDETAAAALTAAPADDVDRVAGALRAGQVVVDDERYLDDGHVTLSLTWLPPGTYDRERGRTRTVTAPAVAQRHRPQTPRVMMTEATARSLALGRRTTAILATTSRVPTDAEHDRALAALAPLGSGLYARVEPGPPAPPTRELTVLAILAAVVTLGATATATGLAAVDHRPDLATLAAVGASPGIRRTLSVSQAAAIAGIGSLLGVAAGLGASTAVLFALQRHDAEIWPAPTPYPVPLPWPNLATALLVVPLVAMLAADLLTRTPLPIERRQR